MAELFLGREERGEVLQAVSLKILFCRRVYAGPAFPSSLLFFFGSFASCQQLAWKGKHT